jgi:hypothetical protein
VGGKQADFFYDPAQGLAHGDVTFTGKPLKIEVNCSPEKANALPEKPVAAAPLVLQGALEELNR